MKEAGMELDKEQKELADDAMDKGKYLEQQRELHLFPISWRGKKQ